LKEARKEVLNLGIYVAAAFYTLRGHPFMMSTKKSYFDLPVPLCGRPHAVDMKYSSFSRNG